MPEFTFDEKTILVQYGIKKYENEEIDARPDVYKWSHTKD